MAVTDLTNTKWLFNSIPILPSTTINYSINFNSNDNNYSVFHVYRKYEDPQGDFDVSTIYYGDTYVFSTSWSNEAYRTIEITGGTDVTNATLISWLEANAVQQGTASLVNTKWKFKDSPNLSSFPAAGTSYNVTFVSNATDYTLLKLATASITYNTTAVYTGTTPLTAPSIALSSDIVTITDNDGNATGFKVYWDGSTTIAETITKTS